MATKAQLPINAEGACMACSTQPPGEERLVCATCATPWHVLCVKTPPESLLAVAQWVCPDCDVEGEVVQVAATAAAPVGGEDGGLVAKIRAIEADGSLTVEEKARRRQELMTGGRGDGVEAREDGGGEGDDVDLGGDFDCCLCLTLLERPVTVCLFDTFLRSELFSGFCSNLRLLLLKHSR